MDMAEQAAAVIEEEQVGAVAAKRLYPLFIGQIFALIFTALVLITATRLLGPALYGLYSFAFGYQAFIDGFAIWGIGAYLNKELASHNPREEFSKIIDILMSGFAVVTPIAFFLTLLGVGLSGFVASTIVKGIGISSLTLILASFTTLFIMLQGSVDLALVGLNRSDLNAIASVSTDIMQLISIILLVDYGYGVNGAVAGMLIGYAAGTALSFYFLYKVLSRYGKFSLRMPSVDGFRSAFNFSLPIAMNNFLNNGIQNLSIIVLGVYVSVVTLGNYGAAIKGLGLMSLIYSTLGTVTLPTFAHADKIKKKEQLNETYNKVILYSLIIVLPIFVYITAFAQPELYLAVSGKYSTAPIYLAIISIATVIYMFGNYVGNLLISKGYTKEVLMCNVYTTIIEVASMFVFVAVLGGDFAKVIGAIVAVFFINNIIISALLLRSARKLLHIDFEYGKVVRLYACAFALGLVLAAWLLVSGYLFPNFKASIVSVIQLTIGFAILIVSYPALLAAFRVMRKEDVATIRQAIGTLGRLKPLLYRFLDYSSMFIRN